jgi:light-regulated signal transduction histidine kinase (bacteriophytochrome)
VSHDLRAPLRIIDGFGEILAKDYSHAFDEEGKHTLEVIMSNARHMGQLIDDLLNLSRLGRSNITVKRVDMREIVEDVIQVLGVMDPQVGKSEIKIHAMIPCECDLSLIRQVWINLISNAVKYSRKNEHPLINIGSEIKDGRPVYYIKDNGVGFDMKYYNKLFGVFQRLHKISEFEGTGVGLALVHRIVTKHGGKVWAEAIENQGAAFYFTLTA